MGVSIILKMEINFECKKCDGIFNTNVGEIKMNEESFRPVFESPPICPKYEVLKIDNVLLTELGQAQMTQATLDI